MSATRDRTAAGAAPAAGGPSLGALQAHFFAALSACADPDRPPTADPALLATIVPRPPLDAGARLAIYGRMYWLRILDALAGDFPRVAAAVGESVFERLARAYLRATPSTRPSLRDVGRSFPTYLERAAVGPQYLPDLARLEWSRVEAFDAPDPRPVARDAISAVPPASWAALRFRPIAALACLRVGWPVHAIWAAEQPAREPWRPAATTLRIWRAGFVVYHASMDALEACALAAIAAGAPFATVCDRLTTMVAVEDAPAAAAALVLRWVDDGILELAG